MSEKTLIERGAECVAGDLILNRVIVGRYRMGQFILTPEGADEVNNVIEVEATTVSKPATQKAVKGARGTKTPDTVDAELKALPSSVDDLVSGLDAALGA